MERLPADAAHAMTGAPGHRARWDLTSRPLALCVGALLGVGCDRPTVPPAISQADPQPQAALVRNTAANQGPDIVLYLVDDQSWHSFTRAIMPQVYSRLVDVGTLFRLGFVVTADCCPSRVGFLAGVFQHSPFHGVFGDVAPAGGATAWHGDSDALPVWLQSSGYYTAYVGAKYLNQYEGLRPWPYVPPRWDSWRVKRRAPYFGDSLVTRVGAGSTTVTAESMADYTTDRTVTWAAAAMRDAPLVGPLFLEIGTNAPHDDYTPPPRYATLYQTVAGCGSTAPHTPASYEEPNVSDQPQFVRAKYGKTSQRGHADTAWQKTCGAVRAIDDMVGATLDSLASIRGNRPTLACYVSDNGYLWGEHWLREAKWSAFEESSGVPYVCAGFNGLNVVARTDTASLVQMIDLTATIVDYSRASATHALSGRSLRPILETGTTPSDWRVEILLEQYRPSPINQNYSCVRTLIVKYCVYQSAETTLYDLRKFPHETWNAVHVPAYAAAVATLGHRLDSLKLLP